MIKIGCCINFVIVLHLKCLKISINIHKNAIKIKFISNLHLTINYLCGIINATYQLKE
jgi:hypothetical protein